MSKHTFFRRAQAVEDEFFHRVDQELVVRLQEQHCHECDEDALAVATGITDRDLLDQLLAAEITPKTLVAFSLFPAVYVAWADGHVESAERKAVLQAAHDQGVAESTPAYLLLESWLKSKPSDELVNAWKEFVHAVRPTLSASAFHELHEAAMKRAHEIAEAAGGFLKFFSVSAQEKAALDGLDAVFVDAATCQESAREG